MKAVLAKLGFQARPQKATSHEQWVKGEGEDFRRVTVDCPKAPFTDGLLSIMLHQMGISKKEFFRLLDGL